MANGAHERWQQRRQTGLKIRKRVRIIVHDSFAGAFSKDGAPNKAQRRRAFGGCGRWHLTSNTAEDRTTWVESIGQGQKRGWSVVCEPRVIQSASGWVSRFFFFFFFENPRTPGGPTSSGLIVTRWPLELNLPRQLAKICQVAKPVRLLLS